MCRHGESSEVLPVGDGTPGDSVGIYGPRCCGGNCRRLPHWTPLRTATLAGRSDKYLHDRDTHTLEYKERMKEDRREEAEKQLR